MFRYDSGARKRLSRSEIVVENGFHCTEEIFQWCLERRDFTLVVGPFEQFTEHCVEAPGLLAEDRKPDTTGDAADPVRTALKTRKSTRRVRGVVLQHMSLVFHLIDERK